MISNFFKFILGFTLAIAVLLGSGITIALYFFNRTTILPEKPIFANDPSQLKSKKQKINQAKATSTSKPKSNSKSNPKPTPKPTPTSLPPGAYLARVTWPQGLSIRAQPALGAKNVGGIPVNQKVIILQTSQDKRWQKIRVEGSSQEGWVKAGNTKRID